MRAHPLAFSTSPHKNTVGIEQSVDVMTILVAKSGAQSYLEESMLVVAAAGMAASSTDSRGESPETSRLCEALGEVLSWRRDGVSQQEAFARIFARFDEKNSHDWCHTISNAMIVAACLLYGGGDYTRSVCMAVQAGFDTDCNGATVGSVLGMMGSKIGPEWSNPVTKRESAPYSRRSQR